MVSKNRLKSDSVHLGDLEISFRRTVKVPDNQQLSELPPGLGKFPVFQVKDHADQMPLEMVAKGGLFIPMYQREAMWIRFKSQKRYAIKIYIGGVNAISGEPAVENAGAALRRRQRLSQRKSIQDYVVVPDQLWLDGIANHVGQVRQFVAMPMASGHSVEAQITGQDVVGGIQFEITPEKEGTITVNMPDESTYSLSVDLSGTVRDLLVAFGRRHPGLRLLTSWMVSFGGRNLGEKHVLRERGIRDGSIVDIVPKIHDDMLIYVMASTGKKFAIETEPTDLIKDLMFKIQDDEGIPFNKQRLQFEGRRLEHGYSVEECGIKNQDCLFLHLELRGGGGGPEPRSESDNRDATEMNLAPGGIINQNIVEDPLSGGEGCWDASKTVTFNVQILNTDSFLRVTGKAAPDTPINASTYAEMGLPFFSMDEGKTTVSGKFGGIKSIASIDGQPDPVIEPPLIKIGQKPKPVASSSSGAPYKPANATLGSDFFNVAGPRAPFRSVNDLTEEMDKISTVSFE